MYLYIFHFLKKVSNLLSNYIYLFIEFQKKVSFCNFIFINPRLFSTCLRKRRNIAFASFIFFQIINCTTIGFHNKEELKNYQFSNEISYKFCILKEKSISESRIKSLIKDLSNELKIYNIQLDARVLSNYNRPAFTTKNIYHAISSLSLPENCDRLMVLLERNLLDFLIHIILPEVMGLVEGDTRTRGFIYTDYLSINILVGGTPSNILIHENYHFLGCNHHIIMDDCYKSIEEHRRVAIYNYKSQNNFFPSLWQNSNFILDREQVNYIIKKNSK